MWIWHWRAEDGRYVPSCLDQVEVLPHVRHGLGDTYTRGLLVPRRWEIAESRPPLGSQDEAAHAQCSGRPRDSGHTSLLAEMIGTNLESRVRGLERVQAVISPPNGSHGPGASAAISPLVRLRLVRRRHHFITCSSHLIHLKAKSTTKNSCVISLSLSLTGKKRTAESEKVPFC